MSGASSDGAIRSALRHRDFRFLIAGQTVSGTGDWLYSVALIAYVLDRTHSPAWVGLASVIRFLPYVLFGTFGGVIADHYNRKKVMIASDLGCGVVMVGLTLLAVAHGSALGAIILAACCTTFSAVYYPCVSASTPALVGEEDLAAANAVISTVSSVALALGPAIGGLLLLLGSPATAFGVNAATFFVSALLTWPIRTRLSVAAQQTDDHESTPLGRRIAQGFQAMSSSPTVMMIVVLSVGFMLFYGQEIVLYSLASSRLLSLGTHGIGFLFAAIGVGGILAAGFVGRVSRSPRQGGLLTVSAIVSALPMMLLAFVHVPALAYVLLTIEGSAFIVGDVVYTTMLQRILAAEVLGRVMGIMDSVMVVAILVGSVLAPLVVHVAGLPTAMIAAGGLLVVMGLLVLPKARELDRRSVVRAAELSPRVDVLRGLTIFEAASLQTLEALAAAVTETQVAARTVVIREGDEPDDLFVILAGSLEVRSRGEGAAERKIRDMGPGGYFGEIGLLRRIPRTATVTATSDCTLYRISGEDFLGIVAEGPRIAGLLRAGVTSRLARTHPSREVDPG